MRVWLARPWFSSGDGEQLGVVLAPGVRLPLGWKRVQDFELGALLLAVIIASHITGEGQSTWFAGLMLLALYVVLAAAFLFA